MPLIYLPPKWMTEVQGIHDVIWKALAAVDRIVEVTAPLSSYDRVLLTVRGPNGHTFQTPESRVRAVSIDV